MSEQASTGPTVEELAAIEAAEPRCRRLDWADEDGAVLASVVVGPPRLAPGETGVPVAYRKWVDALNDADQKSVAANNLALTSCLWPAREKLRLFLDSASDAVYTIGDLIGALASPDTLDVVKRSGGEWARESGAPLTEAQAAKLAAVRAAHPIARLWACVVDVGAGEELVVAKPARSARHHEARALGAKGRVYDSAELLSQGGAVVEPSAERFAAMVADRPGLALVVGGAVGDLGSPGAVTLGKARPSSRGHSR